MYAPSDLFHNIKDLILKGKSQSYYNEDNNDYYTSCNLNDFESVYLLIDGTYYEIPPAKYLSSCAGWTS